MLIFNIVLSAVLITGLVFLLVLIRKNLALSKLHKHIGNELSTIIHDLGNVEPEALTPPRNPFTEASGLEGEMLDDPGMLATILTAMVHKYGDVRIGITDFTNLGDNSYISVYIDTNSQELLLSLDPNLTSTDEFSLDPFPTPDDGVFH